MLTLLRPHGREEGPGLDLGRPGWISAAPATPTHSAGRGKEEEEPPATSPSRPRLRRTLGWHNGPLSEPLLAPMAAAAASARAPDLAAALASRLANLSQHAGGEERGRRGEKRGVVEGCTSACSGGSSTSVGAATWFPTSDAGRVEKDERMGTGIGMGDGIRVQG